MYPRSVLISALVHALVIGTAIIAPLVASDALPAIQRPMAPFMRAFRTADIPLPATTAPPHTVPTRGGAPTSAPDGIAPEKPAPPRVTEGPTVPFGLDGITTEGLPEGFGTADSLVPLPPPPPPPPPLVPEERQPVPVGGRIKAPARIAYVAPAYPLIAQQSRLQGDVTLETTIGVDGTIQNLRVIDRVPFLDQAAVDAVSRWRYTPTLLNGVPVPVIMTVTVSFRLQ